MQPARSRQNSSARMLSLSHVNSQEMEENVKYRLSRLEKSTPVHHTKARCRCWVWVLAAVVIVALIALIVPLAVVLPRRSHKAIGPAAQSTVIVPLYIYPGGNAWEPLYEAASNHQNLTFLVVINPNSGPGMSSLPDNTYITAVQKLNTYPNIRTIGYVRTDRAGRNVSEVISDISTYDGWGVNSTVNDGKKSLAVNGIFFDEAPINYTMATAEYLTQINVAVKASTGIKGDKAIIHNPGTIPDSRLRVSQTDIQVIVENSYVGYQDQQYQKMLAAVQEDKSGLSYMVHSTPDTADMRDLVDEISQHARYIFVTDLDTDYYESFGRTWTQFINAMSS